MEVKMLEFKKNGDEHGWLVPVEGLKDIPFEIKRIFYIYGSDNSFIRGEHANRKTKFVLISVAGSCKVKTDDGKGSVQIVTLDSPEKGIYFSEMVWKEMYDFSDDAVLLCLASEYYDREEYIIDYNEYINEVKSL